MRESPWRALSLMSITASRFYRLCYWPKDIRASRHRPKHRQQLMLYMTWPSMNSDHTRDLQAVWRQHLHQPSVFKRMKPCCVCFPQGVVYPQPEANMLQVPKMPNSHWSSCFRTLLNRNSQPFLSYNSSPWLLSSKLVHSFHLWFPTSIAFWLITTTPNPEIKC